MQTFRLAKDDSSRALAMADLCYYYRYTNIDSSLFYGQSALALSKKIDFLRGEADALNKLGLALREKGELPKSLDLQFQALKIAQDNNYIVEIRNCFRRIGHVYMDLNDYRKAVDYSLQALGIDATTQDQRGAAIESMDLGDVYQHLHRPDSASDYERNAFDKISLIEDLSPDVYRVLGNIEADKGKPKNALAFYQNGIQAGLDIKDFRTISFIYASMAMLFKKSNQLDSSIYYAKNALQYGQVTSYKKGILLSANLLSELYDSINPKEALRYYKISADAKDSLFGAGNIQTIQTLITQENERKKEVEFAKAGYKNRLRQYGLLTGLAVIIIIALILYRNNRKEQKANKILESALSNLKSAQRQLVQSEKMASLGELTAGIAHEIQNPLNFVNNFSEVSNELIDEMNDQLAKGNVDEAKIIASGIKQNLEKINHHGKRADSIVKGMLQHSRAGSVQQEPTDINVLTDEYVRLSFHGFRAKDSSFNATIKTDFDQSIGKINIIPQEIGRVVMNLLTNAFYALSVKARATADSQYKPTVSISTKKIGNKVEIKISDNGNGIPDNVLDKIFQPFFTTKPTGQGTGLGLSLAYDIVKAHGGELKVETTEQEDRRLPAFSETGDDEKNGRGQGTTFTIELLQTDDEKDSF